MKIALVGGGTGGHIFPLLSLYRYAQAHQPTKKSKHLPHAFLWIGEHRSLEKKIATEQGIDFFAIHAGKLRRYFSFRTLAEPFFILWGLFSSLRILSAQKVDVVFSKGGYVSLPVAIAAWILRIPVYLHESDSVPGLANRLVARFARQIFLTFEHAASFFPRQKTQIIGQILNPELFDTRTSDAIDADDRTHVLVIGGSQGSTRMLEFILGHMDTFSHCRVSVVLGTLNRHFQKFFENYDFVTTYEFLSQSQMGELLRTVDVAITRAGATSLFELAAFHVRMIMIPLPESANNHQYHNAVALAHAGHILIEESTFSQGAILRIKPELAYKKLSASVDEQLSEKPLKNIFDILTRATSLTREPKDVQS